MAKKKSFLKTALGLATVAVAGKVVFDKYKNTKEKFEKEENESASEEIKKYNAVATTKTVEVEDEIFEGCEIKAIASKVIIDLSYATINKDVYINFKSNSSSVLIVLPDGVNATCDIEKVASKVSCEVENSDEDVNTVYIIGKATVSDVEILPFSAFTDVEEDEEDEEDDFAEDDTKDIIEDEVSENADEKAEDITESESEESEESDEDTSFEDISIEKEEVSEEPEKEVEKPEFKFTNSINFASSDDSKDEESNN